jgi:hypothetical protein
VHALDRAKDKRKDCSMSSENDIETLERQNAGGRGDAIARSKRILALVDEYHEKPTTDTRTALRIALMNEFEATPAAKSEGGQNG